MAGLAYPGAMLRVAPAVARLLAFCAFAAFAAAGAVDASAEPAPWLNAFGLERHVVEWPELTAGARAAAARALDADANAALQRALDASFAPARLRSGLALRLREAPGPALASDGPHARALADFAGSPLARGLAAARARAAGPAGLRDFPVFASDLQARRVSAARAEAVRRIERETRLAPHAGALALRVGRAAVRGSAALRCRTSGPEAPAEVRERERLARLLGPFQERLWAWLLFQLRDVPDDDLLRYAAFLERDAARAFHAALDRAHVAVLDAAMRRFRAALLPAVEARCAGP